MSTPSEPFDAARTPTSGGPCSNAEALAAQPDSSARDAANANATNRTSETARVNEASGPNEASRTNEPSTTASGARPALSGRVLAVCLGPGGIPKHPVELARVGLLGLEGDRQRFQFHGGPNRAVCLFSIEDYRALQRDGVACTAPGAFGENVLTEDLDFRALRPDDELAIGDEVRLAIHDVREPCKTLKSVDARFPNLMLGRSGFVCRVIRGGEMRPGATIRRV